MIYKIGTHNVYSMVVDKNKHVIHIVTQRTSFSQGSSAYSYLFDIEFMVQKKFLFFKRSKKLLNIALWAYKDGGPYGYNYDDYRYKLYIGLSRNKIDVIRQDYIEKGYRTV